MQTANILLSLGGDHGNTIPKFRVTAAEIAVLQAIHGNDAVNEVEPLGAALDFKRSHRDERARLIATYGSAKSPDQKPIVENMFPGVAARVFENLNELDLDESMFKATKRLSVPEATIDEEAPALTQEQLDAEAAAAADDEADAGVGDDINDEHSQKSGILD